ncbi:P-loop NTPase fold protein [Chitinophagaceae bacterium MMS25-I14]
MEQELLTNLWGESGKKFSNHLGLENNDRIIFSGKFGMGKTTFLQEFFKNEKKYKVIKLFPVNYSIASNEDIFRYIKYDILYEMLENNYAISEEGKNYLQTSLKFFLKNIHKIGAAFVRMIPQIGKDVADAFEKFDKLKEDYLNYHDKESQTEQEKILEYLAEGKNVEGPFEEGEITKIIQTLLQTKEDSQETVLLIDDLDRVDPEHIFRILNVFAAHFDVKRSGKKDINLKNKFGFDKVIVVCDIQNIRQIFKAKYGVNTDFNGYIDKFYSYDIFEYSIKFELVSLIKKRIDTAPWLTVQGTRIAPDSQADYFNHFLAGKNLFSELLSLLISNDQIDLRNILKWNKLPIKYPLISAINNTSQNTTFFPAIFQLHLLSQIKGDFDGLKDALLACDCKSSPREISESISDLIFILASEHKLDYHPDGRSFSYTIKDINVVLRVDGSSYHVLDKSMQTLRLNDTYLIWAACKVIDFISFNVQFR